MTVGFVISRTGRYKVFPILGTAIAAVGLWLLSGLQPDTGSVAVSAYMLVLGLGLGFVMQVLILAVQNAVPYSQLGVATSAATLFRSIGGSLGTAILGAIFANRLADEVARGAGEPGPAQSLGRLGLGGLAPQGVVLGEEPARDPVGDQGRHVGCDGIRRRTGRDDVDGAHAEAFSSSRVTPSSSSPQAFSNLSTPSRSSWAVTSA